jgi:plastocyanin
MSQRDQDVTASLAIRGTYRRKLPVLAIPFSLLLLVSACGNSSTPATQPTSAPTSATSEPTSSGGAGTALTATVGEEGNADAFTITLTDGAGAEVTSLPAGSYEVKVKDLSKIHNFHLTGSGVEEKTVVPEVGDATWTVNLAAGTYTYMCDPHPVKMKKTFTVTG